MTAKDVGLYQGREVFIRLRRLNKQGIAVLLPVTSDRRTVKVTFTSGAHKQEIVPAADVELIRTI